ncbi:MAG TPA: PPC domain-containing protein, partial [Candidatus Paceibacterota bacterium]|nr:PPC domain-containing protein [Candidatus Paceibacterota bacterium]
VPGWFQATLALYDVKGNELAYDNRYRFNPDPVLHYSIVRDGEYVIEIKDSIYRGREDFVYRLEIGELPFVTSVFPLGGTAGRETAVELTGWNLPGTNSIRHVSYDQPGVYQLSARNGERAVNPVPFAVDALPDCLEVEPDNPPEQAQRITLPVIVNGRIDPPGDVDVFRFEGKAGQEIVAEVFARRLNSPMDSALRLTDASGAQLAFNDDFDDKGAGLETHHADSYLRATLPADGTYFIHLGDTQHQGGPECAYRLRISEPRPDFELRLVPSGINPRGTVNVPVTIYALRRDGFTNEIKLELKDAPEGCVLSGARIPPNIDQLRFTLTLPFRPAPEPFALKLQGRAMIGGREVVRPAIPADDVMQAFAYRHLVAAQQLEVAPHNRPLGGVRTKFLTPLPVILPANGTARIRLGSLPGKFADNYQLELDEPPDGVTLENVVTNQTGVELVLRCDAVKAKPELEGNLIVNVLQFPNAGAPAKAPRAANQKRFPVGVLPAIPFRISSE